MRLINVEAFLERERGCQAGIAEPEFEVLQELDDTTVDYAVLSHRWTVEVNYKEMVKLHKMENRDEIRQRNGYQKILQSSERANNDGFKWLWVDTCCVDKRSSSELSEALNSMFRWYKNAKRCYAYLRDVNDSLFPSDRDDVMFLKSNGWPEWFSRGWTLQELIAPGDLQFFNKNWIPIGDKQSLASELEEITRVPIPVLRDGLSLYRPSAAQVMSRAADRKTSRIEDRAYSLMGLFGVSMPMLYGEGKKAFQRLQLEVIRMSNDQTLFAWDPEEKMAQTSGILADDPSAFRHCHDIVEVEPEEFPSMLSSLWDVYAEKVLTTREGQAVHTFTVTNAGIQIWLPVVRYYGCPSVFEVALLCHREGDAVPITINLAAFRFTYYRYFGTIGERQPLPEYQLLHLAYRDEVHHDFTFTIDDRPVLYCCFARCAVYPEKVTSTDTSIRLSTIDPLTVVVYSGTKTKAYFAIAYGHCFGQGWVHVICDERDTSLSWDAYAKEVHDRAQAILCHAPAYA
ncbi:heterokaryon incompatibility protein-domain-containing protein [Pisolithus marmoratus]|nr:heterokaryon incompatibility protein-domain-containing protein [Pisolithus marmoratus]